MAFRLISCLIRLEPHLGSAKMAANIDNPKEMAEKKNVKSCAFYGGTLPHSGHGS
jgi:hypothetical protein